MTVSTPGEIVLLEEYLEAQPRPACLFRRASQPPTSISTTDASADGVSIVWNNETASPASIQLAKQWIDDNPERIGRAIRPRQSRAALPGKPSRGGSSKPRPIIFRTDTEEGTGSTSERYLKWDLTALRGGEYLVVVGRKGGQPETEEEEEEEGEKGAGGLGGAIVDAPDHDAQSKPRLHSEDILSVEPDFIFDLRAARDAAETDTAQRMSNTDHGTIPSWLAPGEAVSDEIKEFYRMFAGHDWASTAIGPMEGWDPLLRSYVNISLASPFPTVMCWGPEMVLLYNFQYSLVIGRKHPFCLGNTYPLGWSEIWHMLQPIITDAYAGKGLYVKEQEMMLLRGDSLEESYFTYALIPIRDTHGAVVGVYVPNFDDTARVLTERRIKSLQSIHRLTALSHNQDDLVKAAMTGLEENPRDMPFVLFYLADGVGLTTDEERTDAYLDEVASQHSHTRRSAEENCRTQHTTQSSLVYDSNVVFRLAGHSGCLVPMDPKLIPMEIDIPEAVANGATFLDAAAPTDGSITRCIKYALSGNTVARLEQHDLDSVAHALQKNTFGETPTSAIALLVRSSSEDRLHGVLVFGLNTRKTFDKDYEDYVSLVRGLIATGMASLKLHNEDLNRARLLAAMNKRKNEELQVLLKKREDELKVLEARFFSSVEESPAGFWMVTEPESKEVTYINPSFEAMTGIAALSPEEWRTHLHPDDVDRINNEFANAFKRRVKTEFRFLFPGVDGEMTTTHVEGSAGPIFDASGKVVLVTGTLLDVTGRKLNEMAQTERAEQATAMRQQQENLIDFVSHELRNPLSAICLAMDSIEDRLVLVSAHDQVGLAEEVKGLVEDAGVVTLCTVHMQRLVDDVLVMSKLDNDMLQICPVDCCPVTLVNSTMKLFTAELTSKGVDYDFIVEPEVQLHQTVKLDPHRTSQVLINLLTNAAKFTSNSAQRKITIILDACHGRPKLGSTKEAAPTDGPGDTQLYITFTVKDTGKGISPQNLQTLFQRFEQGNSKTHVNYGGHGLGLFICKRLSGLLGGDIYVESEEGKGSTFTFFVRAEEPTQASAQAQDPLPNLGALRASLVRTPGRLLVTAPPSTETTVAVSEDLARQAAVMTTSPAATPLHGSLHILLTEDNVVNLRLLQKQLTKAGATVLTAQNGLEALEQFRKSAAYVDGGVRIDCCLMDIEMPLMGGLECTKEIRRMEASGELRYVTPIIAVTANARDGQQSSMRDAGMTDVVPKPFTTKALMEMIRSLCNTA